MTSSISLPELIASTLGDKSQGRSKLNKSALRQFQIYVGRDVLSIDELTKDFVDEYLSWAVKKGSSPKTIELYRSALRTLFTEACPEAEAQIKQAFKSSPVRRGARTHGLNLEQLRLLAQASFGVREDLTQARDFFLFCVYCGGLDYTAVRALYRESVGSEYLTLPTGVKIILNLNIQALLSKYALDDCRELFPFAQGMTESAYMDKLKEIGERFRLPRIKDHHSEAKAWLSVARELQIETEVMAACAYKRVDSLTHYTGEVSDDQTEIDAAIERVCKSVVDNTEHWYAMKLRPHVTPEKILCALYDNAQYPALRQLKTYYPMEDIKVCVRGKWRQDTKAFIKDVLFFRTKERYVNPVFRIVRDSAWIFRQSNSEQSPYAVISQHDMENFQRAISQFTDDIAMSIVENSTIQVGQKVRLTAGEFAGCEGIIEGEEVDAQIPELRNFYIQFTANNSFKFQIKVCESMLTLLEE
jgi:hypothetical protein